MFNNICFEIVQTSELHPVRTKSVVFNVVILYRLTFCSFFFNSFHVIVFFQLMSLIIPLVLFSSLLYAAVGSVRPNKESDDVYHIFCAQIILLLANLIVTP